MDSASDELASLLTNIKPNIREIFKMYITGDCFPNDPSSNIFEHNDYVCVNDQALLPELEISKVLIEIALKDPHILKYASHASRSNRDIIKTIVEHQGLALFYATRELREDEEICKIAVNKDGLAISAAINPTPTLMLQAVKNNGLALGSIPKKYYNEELLLAAVIQNSDALQFIPEELQSREIVLAALSNNHKSSIYVTKKFKAQ